MTNTCNVIPLPLVIFAKNIIYDICSVYVYTRLSLSNKPVSTINNLNERLRRAKYI
jgi:hypothetical protein